VTTAWASGCSERRSTAAASASRSRQGSQVRSSVPVWQFTAWAEVSTGWPRVSVPVLSKAKARTPASASSGAPPLIRMPRRAAAVSALTMVTGVLITSAHGQAMISSVSPRYSQPRPSGVSQNEAPASRGGSRATPAASATTTGVYQRAKRSMKRWLGARLAWASSTMWMMRLRVLSAARRVTRTSSAPAPLIVPAKTSSPAALSTGTLSPVTGAWLTAELPPRMTPSIGMRSPGAIRIVSPTARSPTGTRVSCTPQNGQGPPV